MSTTTPINPEQPKENKTATYRINTYKMSDEEREKVKKYLQSYSCTLVKNVKSYMDFIVEPDFDIEGMLVAGGFWVSAKKLSD